MSCVLQSEIEVETGKSLAKPRVEIKEKKSFLYHVVGYTGAGLVILGGLVVAGCITASIYFLIASIMAL